MFLFLSDGYLTGMLLWLIAGGFSFWLLLRLRGLWRGQPRRKNWIHAGLSVWMMLAAFTAVELYFALVYDASDSFNMTNVSKKWFKLHVEPQQHALIFADRQGVKYRDDREFPAQLRADQKHLIFLGDSFTFAQGVPDVANRFSNLVRAKLEPASNGRVLVSNLADCGTSLHDIAALLQELFTNRHRVDVAVYVLCLNDIETFDERHRTYYINFAGGTPDVFAIRDTYFLNWVYFRLWKSRRPDVRGYYSDMKDYYAGPPWQRMSLKLTEIHEMCQANGTDFRVVIFPFLHNLGPDYPFREAHRQIVEHCRTLEIPVLDLEPTLSPMTRPGLTVNRFDAHPNELAHRLAAEAMRTGILRDFPTNSRNTSEGK